MWIVDVARYNTPLQIQNQFLDQLNLTKFLNFKISLIKELQSYLCFC